MRVNERKVLRLSLRVAEIVAKLDARHVEPCEIGYEADQRRRTRLGRRLIDVMATISTVETVPRTRARDAQTLALWRYSHYFQTTPGGALLLEARDPRTTELWREAMALRQ